MNPERDARGSPLHGAPLSAHVYRCDPCGRTVARVQRAGGGETWDDCAHEPWTRIEGCPSPVRREDPRAFRVVARALVAATLTELLALALVIAVWGSNDVSWIPNPPSNAAAIAPAVGFGIGVGVAFAVTEGLPITIGLVVGVVAALLAPLGGEFARAMAARWDPIAATGSAVTALASADARSLAAFLTGAAMLYGPLAVVRARGSTVWTDLIVMHAGGLAWLVLALSFPDDEPLTSRPLALLVEARCVAFPVLLRLADRCLDRALRLDRPIQPRTGRARIAVVVVLMAGSVAAALRIPDEELRLSALRLRALSGTTTARFALAESLVTSVTTGLIVGATSTPKAALWTPATCLLPRVGFSAQDRRLRFLREALAIHEALGHEGHVPSMLRAEEIHRRGGRPRVDMVMGIYHEWLPIDERAASEWERRASQLGAPSRRR
jgi:hypothetical protein